ncbi:hypothetical protein H8D57_01770, partial [bacterium]|nr:hypothetical protein [bacterium]
METLLLPPDIQLLKKASSGTPIFENVSSLKSAESGENDGQLFEEVLKKKQTKNTNSVPDQPTGKEIDFELKGIAQQVLTIEPGYAKPGGLQKEAVSKSDNSTPLKIAMLGNNTVLDEKLNIPHSTGSNQSQKPGISIAIAKSHSKDAVRPERNFVKSGHVQSEVLSTFSAKGKTSPFNLQLEPGTTQNAKIIRENKGIAHSQNPESQIKVVKNL